MIKDVEETLLILKKVNMKLNPKKCSFGIEEGKFLGCIVTFEGIRANPEKAKVVVNMPSPSNLKQMQRLSGKLAALNRFLSKASERALPCLDTLQKCTYKKDFHWTTKAEEAFQTMKKLIAKLPTLTALKKEEELMVYLSAANEAVSAVLLVERDGRQSPIHYLSRTLQGAEVNYPPMEKLVLALVHAARRLRRYFQGHTIKVIKDKPISQILNNQEATRRLVKWGVELKAYGIKYAPKSAIKGQVLADFLADAMAEDSSTQEKTSGPNDTLAERESRQEQEAPKTTTPENLKVETNIWMLYTDGASNEHGSMQVST
ncbi:reverse transcriptase domain-containing protein [Tanacetum coccineum]